MGLWLRAVPRLRAPLLRASALRLDLGYRGVLGEKPRQRIYFSRSLSSGDVKWLWPLDRESLGFHVVHNRGARMGFFLMTLNSTSPLKTEDVERALSHLQRKNPAMRVDIRLRDDVWWFCEQVGRKVDFKMLGEGASSLEECRRMSERGFPDGDTWKFRMIPRGKEAPCVMPEVKGDFPYQYDVLMTSHHALGDGLSVSMIVKRMVELLNDVILGRHVDDEATTRFLPREELWEIESRITKKLQEDPERHDFVQGTMPDSSPLLLRAFPRPSADRVTTGYLTRTVDLETTQNFERLCKAQGVTINGAFTSVINIALARLVQKSGISQESYRIASNHLVSVIRYLKQTPRDIMGGYPLYLSHISDITSDRVTDHFWEYAKEVNRELREGLTSELPLEQKLARLMAQPDQVEQWARKPPPVVHDFGITNIARFPMPELREDDQVLVTDATSIGMVHGFTHMLLFLVHTFRDRCNYSLSYATDYFTDETAILLADEVMSVYREVSGV